MPYNGSGTFESLGTPTYPAVTGDPILASYFNATMNDVFLGLSTALPRDGQAAMAANLAMASYKITGLANGTLAQDAVTYSQVFSGGSFTNPALLGVVTATGATSVLVPSPSAGDNSQKAAPTSYLTTYYAPIASPTFTGTPAAPTAATSTSTTQIATTAFVQAVAMNAALPNQSGNSGKYLTTNGTDASWVTITQVGTGGTTSTASVTLTSASAGALSVTPATPGLYATLPDATTCSKADNNYSIYNAGDYDYGVKDSTGTQLGWIRPRTGAMIGLADNASAAGVWAYYGLEKIGTTAQYSNASLTNTGSVIKRVDVDSDRELFVFGGTTKYAITYNKTTQTWGTATTIRTGTRDGFTAIIKSATDQILVVTCDTATAMETVILTLSGTSITVESATKASTTLAGNSSSQEPSLIAVGSSFVFGYARATNVVAIRGITISGVTPTVGAETTLSPAYTYPPTLYVSGSVVRALSYSATVIYMQPFTVSGTTLTPGTAANVSLNGGQPRSFQNGNGNVVVQYVNTTLYGTIFKLTGTTEAASSVSLCAAPSTASVSYYDLSVVSASKTLFCSLATSTNSVNILTDTSGTASAGTAVTYPTDSHTNLAISAVLSSNVVIGSTGNNIVCSAAIDCSGASPTVSSVVRSGNTASAGMMAPFQASELFYAKQKATVFRLPGQMRSSFGLGYGGDCVTLNGSILKELPFPTICTSGVTDPPDGTNYYGRSLDNGSSGFAIQKVEAAV